MKCKDNPKIKNYCSESPYCDVVETGAVLSVWLVCRLCKEEVTEDLKNRVEKKAPDQIELDVESAYNGWTSGNYFTP